MNLTVVEIKQRIVAAEDFVAHKEWRNRKTEQVFEVNGCVWCLERHTILVRFNHTMRNHPWIDFAMPLMDFVAKFERVR